MVAKMKINFFSPINNNPGNTRILTIPPQTGYSLIACTWVNSAISISESLPWAGAWDPRSHTLDVCAAYNLLIPADPWLAAATRPGSEAGWSAVAQPSPGRGQLCQYDVLSSMRFPPNEHHTHSISPHGISCVRFPAVTWSWCLPSTTILFPSPWPTYFPVPV